MGDFTEHYRFANEFISTGSTGNSEENQNDAVISEAFFHKFILLLACPKVVLTEAYHSFLRTQGMREVPISEERGNKGSTHPLPVSCGS